LPASRGGGSASFTDLRGTYSGGACIGGTLAACENSPRFPHTTTISTEDFNSGAISGSGFTGQITGCTVTVHVVDGSYISDETETISADGDTLEGTFNDNNGHGGPIYDIRSTGGPSTCPPGDTTTSTSTSTTTSTTMSSTTTTSTTTTTPGKHATATQVICNYEFASSTNTCGASVGDADASGVTPTQPTGR
jgi:hypothetical protein